MDFNEDDNSFAGSSSTMFGAIFMSNRATKKECFKRKLFGLPSSQSGFVKKVKAGMVLFLFEYEERKLYGVFEASSDGALNIVPNAFRLSGKQIPAQVIFKTIWHCHPLSEHEFRNAIKDNYYSTNKFNFGLTEDQVSKLLLLFNSRKVNTPRSQKLFSRDKEKRESRNSYISRLRVYQEDRFITADSIENKPSMEYDPVNLTNYLDVCRPNLNLLDASHKHILETKNSLVEAPHRLSLTASSSVETQMPNLLCSTSHRFDEHTNPLQNLHPSKTSSFLFDPSSSLGINDHSFATEVATYSKSSIDSLFSLSRGQLISSNIEPKSITMSPSGQNSLSGSMSSRDNLFPFSRSQQLTPFHRESERLNTSQTRCGILDVTSSLGDNIPLNCQGHFDLSSSSIPSSEIENFRNKNMNPINLEHYKGLSFSESSVTELPLPRLENFRHGYSMSSSDVIIPGKGPSHLSECEHPPVPLNKYGDDRTQLSNYEYAAAAVSSSDIGQLHFQVVGEASNSRNEDFYEKTQQESPINWDHDDYEAPLDLYYGDVQKNRLSVFSRLAMTQEATGQDDDYYGYEDISVNQVMGILYQKQSCWRKKSKRFKHLMGQHEDVDDFSENIQNIEMSVDPVSEREDGKCTEGMETPLVNFQRRSKNRKVQDGEHKGMPGTVPKRRKLVRPSFTTGEPACDKDIMGDACYHLLKSSQEICQGKENLGTHTNLVSSCGGEGNERKSSNVNAQNVNFLIDCEHDNAKSEKGSSSKDFKVEKEGPQDGIESRDCLLDVRGSSHENDKMEPGSNTKDFKIQEVTQELGGIRDCSLNVLDSSEDNNKNEVNAGDVQEQDLDDIFSLKTECNGKIRGFPINTNLSYCKRIDDDEKVGQKEVFEAVGTRGSSQNETTTTSDDDDKEPEEGSGNALQELAETSSRKNEGNEDANGFSLELSLIPTNFPVGKAHNIAEQKDAFAEVDKIRTVNGGVIDLNLVPEN